LRNRERLKAAGTFEEHLLLAYASLDKGQRKYNTRQVEQAFRSCDRKRLLDAGDLKESCCPFRRPIVFRGVSGTGKLRRERGLSWSTSLVAACFFATLYSAPKPTVFVADISEDDVFAYLGPGEWEVIVRPKLIFPVKILKCEMLRLAKEHKK